MTNNSQNPDAQSEKSTTLPDFVEWAKRIVHNFAPANAVADALSQAFSQGRSLGEREGRELSNNEWWKDFDKSLEKEKQELSQERSDEDLEQEVSLEEWLNETDEELSNLFETASLEDYLKWEEDQSKIISQEKPVNEIIMDLLEFQNRPASASDVINNTEGVYKSKIKSWKSDDNV